MEKVIKAVPFEKDEVLAYLDSCIVFWRKYRDSDDPIDAQFRAMAPHYIDAYQSVRISLFGERTGEKGI